MSLTFAQVKTNLRERLGDDGSVDWTDTQLGHAIQDAMRVAWPYFYEPVVDETSFTGGSAVAQNTTELAVPTTFYNVTGIGKITRLDWRRYTTSTTNYNQWIPLRRGVWIDDLQEASPKIHFAATRGRQAEIRVRGIRPLTIPTLDADTVSGSNWPGFVVWLYLAAEELARAARVRAVAYDTEAEQQRRILASQEAQDLANKYRMRPPGQTLFSRW